MENIITFLPYVQLVLSILMVVGILAQRSDSALGGVFGGGDDNTTKFTRRGFEKTLFQATVVVAILFAATALLAIAY